MNTTLFVDVVKSCYRCGTDNEAGSNVLLWLLFIYR